MQQCVVQEIKYKKIILIWLVVSLNESFPLKDISSSVFQIY